MAAQPKASQDPALHIPLNRPYMPKEKNFQRYIRTMYKNAWLTNNGPLVQAFTERLRDYLDVPYLVPTSSGTAALQLGYKLFGLEGEVISSPFSFVATSNSLDWVGLEIKYADIELDTFNISPAKIKAAITSRTSAIVPVHVYGNPCNTKEIKKIAEEHNLKVIYDAAHAFGIEKDRKSILTEGDASAISLHATKVFHSIEGGALILNKEEDFKKAMQMINFGIAPDNSGINLTGFNGKMSEAHAAMGLAMLDDIDAVIDQRLSLYNLYKQELQGHVDFPTWDSEANQNAAYFPIVLQDNEQMKNVFEGLKSEGIQSRPYFSPSLNTLTQFTNGKRVLCPNSERISKRVLCIPLFYSLGKASVKRICHLIKQFV